MPEHVAIVAGASQGIGLAIARALAADGMGLCLVAAPDDEEQLREVAAELDASRSPRTWATPRPRSGR